MKNKNKLAPFLLNISVAAFFSACLVACGSDSSSNPDLSFSTENSSAGTNSSAANSNNDKPSSSSSTVRATSSSSFSKALFLNENISYGEITDERDGQTYKTVLIGSRYWMAENLNFKTENSYCVNDNDTLCLKYGRLYAWSAAMDSAGAFSTNGLNCGNGKKCTADSIVRGVCPQGWHLPNYSEFSALYGYAGGIRIATRTLKTRYEWGGGHGNELGFSAVPAGYREDEGYYYSLKKGAYFWLNSESYETHAQWAQMYDPGELRANTYYNGDIITDWYFAEFRTQPKSNAASVRCVRDSVPGDTTIKPFSWRYMDPEFSYGTMTDERDGRVYRTTTIGSQTWMAENLNFKTEHGRCLHRVDENCEKYGTVYPWSDATDSIAEFSDNGKGCGYIGFHGTAPCEITYPARGICPQGWHLPSTEEFSTLFEAVGGQEVAGKMLKSKTEWYSGTGLDSFGFTARPADNFYDYSPSTVLRTKTGFWSSNNSRAVVISFEYKQDSVFVGEQDNRSVWYIRCLKD